jgi:hypothetical protein
VSPSLPPVGVVTAREKRRHRGQNVEDIEMGRWRRTTA